MTLACLGLLSFALASPRARAARAAAARPTCSSNGASGSFFLYGRGAKLVSETDLPVCVTGGITVTFAGAPTAGCAAHGLCAYAGTERWRPQGPGTVSISTFTRHGRRSVSATLLIGGGPGATVRAAVQRSQPDGVTTACSDSNADAGGFFMLPVSGGRATIGLRRPQGSLLGSRCAGPLDADLAAALPARTVSLSRIRHGRTTVDLTGTAPFAADGLAGTVDSTIVLTLGRPRRGPASGTTTPPPGVRRSRLVEVAYRVTHLGGSAVAAVSSAPVAAVCGPFDACGLGGSIDVAPETAQHSSINLTATAPLRRPERDLLTALGVGRGGDPSGIAVVGAGLVTVHGVVAADLTQGGGACRDRAALRQLEVVLAVRAHRLRLAISPIGSQAGDPLRTRCPGPDLGSHPLTSASLPLSVLRHRSFTATLRGGSFSDGPYRVTTQSTLTVTLRRARVTTRIEPY